MLTSHQGFIFSSKHHTLFKLTSVHNQDFTTDFKNERKIRFYFVNIIKRSDEKGKRYSKIIKYLRLTNYFNIAMKCSITYCNIFIYSIFA